MLVREAGLWCRAVVIGMIKLTPNTASNINTKGPGISLRSLQKQTSPIRVRCLGLLYNQSKLTVSTCLLVMRKVGVPCHYHWRVVPSWFVQFIRLYQSRLHVPRAHEMLILSAKSVLGDTWMISWIFSWITPCFRWFEASWRGCW